MHKSENDCDTHQKFNLKVSVFVAISLTFCTFPAEQMPEMAINSSSQKIIRSYKDESVQMTRYKKVYAVIISKLVYTSDIRDYK